jgi:hypothetical protein
VPGEDLAVVLIFSCRYSCHLISRVLGLPLLAARVFGLEILLAPVLAPFSSVLIFLQSSAQLPIFFGLILAFGPRSATRTCSRSERRVTTPAELAQFHFLLGDLGSQLRFTLSVVV